MLSVTNDRASRLHQAITPSSEQCYYIVYASLSQMPALFTCCLQNISNTSSPGKTQKRRRRIDYLANHVFLFGVYQLTPEHLCSICRTEWVPRTNQS